MVPTRSNYDEIKFKQIYYAGEVHEIYYVYIMENMKKKLSPEHYLILCRLCVLMILYYDTGFGGGRESLASRPLNYVPAQLQHMWKKKL